VSALFLALAIVVAAMQPSGIEVIARDGMSAVDEPRTAVANTEAEWAALWRSHAFEKPLPKVDFATRRVLAIFLGSRPTAGFGIEIVGTKTESGNVVVEWAEMPPKPGSLLAQVLTSPALFVSIEKAPGTVTFRKVTR
jgi:hypothetical protein